MSLNINNKLYIIVVGLFLFISVKLFANKNVDVHEDVVKVILLGEIKKPGNYVLQKDIKVGNINQSYDLFDEKKYEPSVTLIRKGKRQKLSGTDLLNMSVQQSDIYLYSLSLKPEPKPVSSARINDVLEKKSTSEKIDNPPVAGAVKPEKVKPSDKTVDSPAKIADELTKAKKQQQGYYIKPGDILTIGLPGEEGFNEDFVVSRDGTIRLPEVGLVNIAGKPFKQVDTLIYDQLSDVFLGLDKLTVALKEKRLLITVLGYVQQPGEVELPRNGNIQMAINMAGGLMDGAQLDKLQLQRDKSIQEFNYKHYLDSGDISLIPELQSLDVIFVPSSPELGNVHGDSGDAGMNGGMDPTEDRSAIKVFGEVIRPGSFPYKEGMTLVDALLRAGGVTRYSNVEQIRVIDKGEPVLFNLKNFLDNGSQDGLSALSEGATIFVPKQVEAVQGGGRIVYVMGQVQKPGSFETGTSVTFLDVLANAGGPNRYADTRMVRILRSNGEVVPFNLENYAEGGKVEMPAIMPGDAIFIPLKSEEEDLSWTKVVTEKSVKLMGAIKKPGRYEWSPNVTFLDLIGHAQGPTKEADLAHIQFLNPGPNGEVITEVFNLQAFLEQGGKWSDVPKLVGGSTIIFPELPESPIDNKAKWVKLPKEQAIYIMGSVKTPGRFAFNEKLGLLDILSAAGGPTSDADLARVRIAHRNENSPRVSRVNLLEFFETGDETLLPQVKTGDNIFIPSKDRSWVEKKKEETVRVLGAVKESGRYDYVNEMTILDLLAEAGGPTNTAFVEKIIIVNMSCCKNQAYTFDLMDFMKDPDASRLPVLRAGDTIYVPDASQSYWGMFLEAVKDSLSVLSLVSIINGF